MAQMGQRKLHFYHATFLYLFKASGFRTKTVKVKAVYKESVEYIIFTSFFKRIVKLKKTEGGGQLRCGKH